MGKFWDKIKNSFTQTANEQKAKYEPGGKYSNTPAPTSTPSTPSASSTPAGGAQANPSSSPTAGYMNNSSHINQPTPNLEASSVENNTSRMADIPKGDIPKGGPIKPGNETGKQPVTPKPSIPEVNTPSSESNSSSYKPQWQIEQEKQQEIDRQNNEAKRREEERRRQEEEERRRQEEEARRQEAERKRQEEEAMKNQGNSTPGLQQVGPGISGSLDDLNQTPIIDSSKNPTTTTPSDTNKPQWQIEAEKEAAKRQEEQRKKLEEEKKKQEAAQNAGGIIGGNAGNAATESDKEIETNADEDYLNNLKGDEPISKKPSVSEDASDAEVNANAIKRKYQRGDGKWIIEFEDGHSILVDEDGNIPHQEPKEEPKTEDTSGGGDTTTTTPDTTTPDTTTPSTGGDSALDGSKVNLNKATADLLNEFLSVMKDPSRILDFANKYGWVMGQNAAANASTAAQMAGMNKSQAAMMGQNAAAQNSMQGFGKGADMRAGLAGSAGNMASGLINAQLNRDMFNQQQAYNKQQTGLNIFGGIAKIALPIILGAIFGSDSRLKTITKVDGKPVKRSKYFDQAVGKIDKYITTNKPKDYKSLIWRQK